MIEPAPILTWVGGKSRLLSDLRPKLTGGNRFYDAFLGGAAVTCAMMEDYAGSHRMFAGDRSEPLLILYGVLREGHAKNVHAKAEALLARHLAAPDPRSFYNQIRSTFNTGLRRLGPEIQDGCLDELVINYDSIMLAAQMLYLNRLCFNGLWRMNSKGKMNSPYAVDAEGSWMERKMLGSDAPFVRYDLLHTFGTAFAGVDLDHRDWRDTVASARSGDVVYLDPPYASADDSDFTAYSDKWTWLDALDLVREANVLAARGVRVVTSQSIEGSYAFGDTWEREYVYLGTGISRSTDKSRAEVILWKGPMP